ncbi:ATP-binding cassette domain-containing protein [Conexibacter woesei]|uniref:ABC transporter related protein n=1 Tax=Conexibacter woesei (strain DSM 14684 / CCUG 47730 / CIP 108061 / JCM 11494 / NBRC 100937 / ID131577) TaxID=469383 RepID=D3FA48_CONWI|nr:ATP-binding cassette domain-containing protein [Conexibacter woesei]ADB53143.1 ABC transporter related protein [Conexibacter woesei DSM 14684]
MPLLALAGVAKRYTQGSRSHVALDDLALDVESGDFVAIWGSSRSGKTTLLRVAAGLERPDAGTVTYGGADVARLSRRRRADLLLREIGCVWQTGRITRGLSVVDHVALPRLRDVSHVHARREAYTMLERLSALPCAHARWHELTDGDRTRVALAHALVRRPRLLLADEPTANLNLIERERMLTLLRAVAEDAGVAVVMTAPDAPNLLQAHRIMGIDRGRLIKPRSEQPGALLAFPGGGRRAHGGV